MVKFHLISLLQGAKEPLVKIRIQIWVKNVAKHWDWVNVSAKFLAIEKIVRDRLHCAAIIAKTHSKVVATAAVHHNLR